MIREDKRGGGGGGPYIGTKKKEKIPHQTDVGFIFVKNNTYKGRRSCFDG